MHLHFPEIHLSASLLQRTYKKYGVKFKYIIKKKKIIDYAVPYYRDLFDKMVYLLQLVDAFH